MRAPFTWTVNPGYPQAISSRPELAPAHMIGKTDCACETWGREWRMRDEGNCTARECSPQKLKL